jgi:hypothetical protein
VQSAAEHAAPIDDREALLEQVLESGASDELALLHSVHSAAAAVQPTQPNAAKVAPSPWTRWWPAAAAALLLLSVGIPLARQSVTTLVSEPPTEPRYRGGPTAGAPQLRQPVGDAVLMANQQFAWSVVADAVQYTIEIVDGDGQTISAFAATDTVVVLPTTLSDSVRVRARGWSVSARMRDGRLLRSELRLLRAP